MFVICIIEQNERNSKIKKCRNINTVMYIRRPLTSIYSIQII